MFTNRFPNNVRKGIVGPNQQKDTDDNFRIIALNPKRELGNDNKREDDVS